MKTYRFTECGVKHRLQRLDNQDACFVESHGGHAFAFMADGMSSARFGDEAANIAVEAGCDIMGRLFMPFDGVDNTSGKLVVRASFPAAHNAIQRSARDEEDLNDLLTTFMAAYLNESTGRLHVGYCGDGGVVARFRNGGVRLVTTAHKGAKRSQTTQVLDYGSWEFESIEGVSAFMMLTDGLFDALCPDGLLPEGDPFRMEALRRLLEAPLALDDPRMRPYLDRAFSSQGRNDDLGALFEHVGDDRSVIIVSVQPGPACQGASRAEALSLPEVLPRAGATPAVAALSTGVVQEECAEGAQGMAGAVGAQGAPAAVGMRAAGTAMPGAAVAAGAQGAAATMAVSATSGAPSASAPSALSVASLQLPLTPQECEQVRLIIAAYGGTRRSMRYRKRAGGHHAFAR